jgi:hypothetical protein
MPAMKWPRAALDLRLAPAVLIALLVAFQGYVLFVKRFGETAYLPSASRESPSLEIAGDAVLGQTFVMGADGLEGITLFPRPSGTPRGSVHLTLFPGGGEHPLATQTVPAGTMRAPSWTWRLPRIADSAGRPFLLYIAVPDARPGEGLRFAIGEPTDIAGLLAIGGRPQLGDLKFATHARRARAIDVLRNLRRRWPPVIRSTAFLVGLLVVFDVAAAVLLVSLSRAAPPDDVRNA